MHFPDLEKHMKAKDLKLVYCNPDESQGLHLHFVGSDGRLVYTV